MTVLSELECEAKDRLPIYFSNDSQKRTLDSVLDVLRP